MSPEGTHKLDVILEQPELGQVAEQRPRTQSLSHSLPGIRSLIKLDALFINQHVNLREMLSGVEQVNQYQIKNTNNDKLFVALEDSSFACQFFCCDERSFVIKLYGGLSQFEGLSIERPLRRCGCCMPCWCNEQINVSSRGVPLGTVVKTWNPILPTFAIRNNENELVAKIRGPFITASCGGPIAFVITSPDGAHLGDIVKLWAGAAQEFQTSADNFKLTFPVELDLSSKGLLLAAVFLIDFIFFERNCGCC